MSLPWGTAPVNVTPSLSDVMSEELAKELENKEKEEFEKYTSRDVPNFTDNKETKVTDESDDHVLALILQGEFDREHDEQLRREQARLNGNSKVTLSFERYERREMTKGAEPYSDDEEEDDEDTYVVSKDPALRGPARTMNRAGYSGKGKDIQTKHDPDITAQRNASRLEERADLATGDTLALRDMKLPNKVYNSLRVHEHKMARSAAKLKDRKDAVSTAESALDERSRKLLFKQVTSGRLDDLTGVVSTGKESVVLHARGGPTPTKTGRPITEEVAIKVFKTTLNEFKTRALYVNGDFRFAKDQYKKHNPRKLIKIWAEKECLNLCKMRRFNIPCPEPLLRQQHILLMSFIGEDQRAAPKLKDARLSPEQLHAAYGQSVSLLRRLLHDCHLVHGDFSEYNLLWWKDQVWIIDVSCAVDHIHPHALEFLYRDCRNISTYFMRNGVSDVMSGEKLFNHLTGANIKGDGQEFLNNFADYLSQLQDYEKDSEMLAHGLERTSYPFDHFFKDTEDSDEDEDFEDEIALNKESSEPSEDLLEAACS